MNLGDAFTMAVPPKYDIPHLFFVISDPAAYNGDFVVVNITTDYIRAGKECVLSVGEHDWINGTSYVSFRDAMLIDAEKAMAMQSLVGTLIKIQRSLSAGTLNKIVEAAKKSRGFPLHFKALL